MKRIIFVRHGKSSWEYPLDDKDRPLKERGVNDAHVVAQELLKKKIQVDRAFSSPANRALHTAMIFLRNLNFDLSKFHVNNQLYDFSGDSVLHFLKGLPDELKTVLVFGHNHAFTSLVNMLGDDYIENLPTTGIAIIEIDVEQWQNVRKGETKEIIFPKELR